MRASQNEPEKPFHAAYEEHRVGGGKPAPAALGHDPSTMPSTLWPSRNNFLEVPDFKHRDPSGK